MRRLLLLMSVLLLSCALPLVGIIASGRITDAPVCLQYHTYDNTSPIYGVIDANTGATLIDHGRSSWTYLYTANDISLAAKRHSKEMLFIQNQSYASYDLAVTSFAPDTS